MKLKKPINSDIKKLRAVDLNDADDDTLDSMSLTLRAIHGYYQKELKKGDLDKVDVPIVTEICNVFAKVAEEKRKRAMIRSLSPK